METNFKTTTDHDVIREWVESQGGKPALILDPNTLDKDVGLRIDFPGRKDQTLLSKAHRSKQVSWNEFFEVFENQKLAFSFLKDPGHTDLVDSYLFIKRENVDEKDVKNRFDPKEFAAALQDPRPVSFSEEGKGLESIGIASITPDDVASEESLGGDTPDLEADDNTTQAAKDAGLLDPDDKKRLHDTGEL